MMINTHVKFESNRLSELELSSGNKFVDGWTDGQSDYYRAPASFDAGP